MKVKRTSLRRAVVRLRRKASLCLPALALALALGTAAVTLPPDAKPPAVPQPTAIPLVNWNS